jgi:hypothetical protein
MREGLPVVFRTQLAKRPRVSTISKNDEGTVPALLTATLSPHLPE